MTQMTRVGSTAATPSIVNAGPVGTTAGAVPSNADNLPPPNVDPADAMGASLEVLLLLSQQQDSSLTGNQSKSMQQDSVVRKNKLDAQIKEMKEQADKANSTGFFGSILKVVKDFAKDLVTNPAKIGKDLGANIKAALNSPNFWADLKKICMKVVEVAAVVASAVATVFSAGAASVVVAGVILAISALNFAQSEFNIAKQIGLSPKAASWIQMGLAVVAIALSFGTNTSAAVGAARAIKEVTTGVQVAGTAVGGVATVADAHFQADALDRQARIKELKASIDSVTEDIQDIIESIKEHKDAGAAIAQNVTAIQDQKNQTIQSLNVTTPTVMRA